MMLIYPWVCTASVIAGSQSFLQLAVVNRSPVLHIVNRLMQLVPCLDFKYPVSSAYAIAIYIDYIKAPI